MFAGPLGRSTFTPPKSSFDSPLYGLVSLRRSQLPFVSAFTPGITLLGQLLYGLDFDTIAPEQQVANIAPRPILFIHGSDDPRIPVEHASRLKAASGNPANELWILKGYGHTEGVWMGPEHKQPSPMRDTFLQKVCTFFKNALQ